MTLPIITVFFFLGVGVQVWQLAQAVPGAGMPSCMEAAVNVLAQQALIFGAACVATASTASGLVSVNTSSTLPAGISTLAGAVCMATIRADGGRNICDYMPVAPNAAGFLIQNTQGNATWFRVNRQDTAMSMIAGVTYAVSTIIPVDMLIDWVQTTT